MSVESLRPDERSGRHLTDDEQRLVRALLKRSPDLNSRDEQLDNLRVVPMSDGGMGSLRFLSSTATKMAKKAAELTFLDSDGVRVIASLNIDKDSNLFELDIWKTNFSALIRIPDELA